jgi:hypothetical protein
LSHDDLYHPNKVEKSILLINKLDGKYIIFNDYELINSNKEVINKLQSPKNKKDIFFKLISNTFALN